MTVEGVELLQGRDSLAVLAVHHRHQLGWNAGEAGVVLAVADGGGRHLAGALLAQVVLTLVQLRPGQGVVVDLDGEAGGVVDGDRGGGADVEGGGRRHPAGG